jgi:hypothetical protein
MPAELLAAMVLLDLRVQPEHLEVRDQQDHKDRKDQQGHKAYRDSQVRKEKLGKSVQKAHKVHKGRQGLRVQGSATETPRGISSIGTGLLGRT